MIAALLTVATGIARAAIDDLIQLAGTKSPAYTAKPLKARGTVQMKIGRAKGALDAARAYLRQSLLGIWTEAEKGHLIYRPHKITMQLPATHAVIAAAEAVDLVQMAAGTTGIREVYGFERYFRDVHSISQHAFISPSRFESVGQLLRCVPVEWPIYGL